MIKQPRRSFAFDVLPRWLFLVLLPALLLAPFRALRWLWRLQFPKLESRSSAPAGDFYRSTRWRKLRVRRMELNVRTYGKKTCELCFTIKPGGAWEVHHIKSRSRYPELALVLSNTALLCPDCNQGLSNDYADLELNRCPRKAA